MNIFELKTFRYFSLIFFTFIVSILAISLMNIENIGSTYVYDAFIDEALRNTIVIGISVVLITTLISMFFAVFNVYYDLKYKKIIHILTFIPMAIPCYILAYKYNTLLSHGGELSFLDISISNIYGTIIIYSLSFFPYSYMIIRSTLSKIPYNIIESSVLIDKNFFITAIKILIPLVTKSIIASSVLILGEVFSDIGVVEYFNIPTLSTVIKQTYVINNNYGLALQVGLKFGLVLVLIFVIESIFIPNINYKPTQSKIKLIKTNTTMKIFYYISFALLLLISFITPVFFMIKWTISSIHIYNFELYFDALKNTLLLILVVIIIISIISIIISHITTFNKVLRPFYTIFNIWYILPSILIGLIITVFFTKINETFGTLIISSLTILVLIIAYVIKYLPLSLNIVSKQYSQISKSIIESAVIIKKNRYKTFFSIDAIIIKGSILTSTVILVTDLVKELTLAYTLRPFNFETLSTMTALYAKDEMIHESSIYSLTIIFICLMAVLTVSIKEVRK